jgi:hypothetical protein
MNRGTARGGDETAFAVHSANSADCRKSLETPVAAAYSPLIDNALAPAKDHTMYATDTVSVATKLTAFVVALVANVIVLGSTVAGMQPREDASQNVAALERVTVTATRTN